ncbi:hypothetical protein CHUAL_003739 [Chamberlinius hualienensis]
MDVMGGCEVCGSVLNLQRCSQCKGAVYCSREHQISDWVRHKTRCQQRLQPNSEQLRISHPVNNTFIPLLQFGSEASSQRQQQPSTLENLFEANTANFDLTKTESSSFDINSQVFSDSSHSDLPDDYLQFLQNQTNGESSTSDTTQINDIGLQLSALSWSDQLNSENYLPSRDYLNGSNQSRLAGDHRLPLIDYTQTLFEEAGAAGFSEQITPAELQMETINELRTNDLNNLTSQNEIELSIMSLPKNVRHLGLLVNWDRVRRICAQVIFDMNTYGICVIDEFLPVEIAKKVLSEVVAIHNEGRFIPGEVVNPGLKTVRGDKITWLSGKERGVETIGFLMHFVDVVVKRVSTAPNNGKLAQYKLSQRTRAMVACYPGGGTQYIRHVDNPNKDGRCITSIYYLNENWNMERDGGTLRIYPQEHKDSMATIIPNFNRMVFFWSDRRNPHEVEPANRLRYAITLWYQDEVEKNAASQKQSDSNKTQHSAGVSPEI